MVDAKKNLKYFMRSMEPEVVTAPGCPSITDDEGNILPLEIKVLSQEDINRINDAYRKRSMATDKKGNPLIAMGEVVWKTEKDQPPPDCRGVAVPEPQGQGTDGVLPLRRRDGYAAQGISESG